MSCRPPQLLYCVDQSLHIAFKNKSIVQQQKDLVNLSEKCQKLIWE